MYDNYFTADFETNTDPNYCWVWAVGIYNIFTDKFVYLKNIMEFICFLKEHTNSVYYFHNLKFDGEFIISYLLKNNYKYVHDRKKLDDNTFNILMSDTGQFYSMDIGFDYGLEKLNTVKIIDSLKILPMSVSEISKAFGLEESKLTIDYDIIRSQNYTPTDNEYNYVKNDVVIMGKALNQLFKQNLKKQTIGSNALADYKHIITSKNFKKYYPELDYNDDAYCRKSYKGGFTYLNPDFKNVVIGSGIVLDVNSLYPYVLYSCMLPYGRGIYFEGKYQNDDLYNIYIQKIRCQFEIKPNKIPTIQIKKSIYFISNEYLLSSDNEIVELTLTSVDLKLFLEHYDVYNLEYIDGYKFKSTDKLFKDYVSKWYEIKKQATIDGNKGLRTIAKLMQNSLYGKFGLNPNVCSKYPVLNDGIVKYVNNPPEIRDTIYVPLASFCTSYARNITIRAAQKLKHRFIYADTDSLHLVGTDYPDILEIDNVKLGAWKLESKFTRAKFLRQKTYIEEIDGELKITCSGMPKSCYPFVTFDNFTYGQVYEGKLLFKHTDGGQYPVKTDFTIKL